MILRGHLQDDRLHECYLVERRGDPIDPPTAEHLADCAACGQRYNDFTRFMDQLRSEGVSEADAIFTRERLRLQQAQIARRLEQIGRPARVISFPRQFVRRTLTASTAHTAPRWIAAAAAAGLFVGVALGASYEFNTFIRSARHSLIGVADGSRPARLTPVATRGSSQPDVAADDAFLSDLDVALERPHTRELLAFDAFTPHVREVRDQR